MKLSESGKNKEIFDVFENDPEVAEGIVYLHGGLRNHKSAKTVMSNEDSVINSTFTLFQREWSAQRVLECVKSKSDVIMEFGCCDMQIYNCFEFHRSHPNYIGVDVRTDYMAGGAKHLRRKNVLGICANLSQSFPIKDGSISAIFLNEVMEHLPYEDNVLMFKEAFRLLKPGGKVLIGAPINTKGRKFHDPEKEASLGHVFFWEAEQFEKEMLGIGYSSVDMKWGYSSSSAIRIDELKKSLPPDVQKFIGDIGEMYGSHVARAIALSAPNLPNGGCRFTLTK